MAEYQVNHLIVHRTDDVACKTHQTSNIDELFRFLKRVVQSSWWGHSIQSCFSFICHCLEQFTEVCFIRLNDNTKEDVPSLDRLFADLNKFSGELKKELEDDNVQLYSYEDFSQQLKKEVQNEDPSQKFCVNILSKVSPLMNLSFRSLRRVIMLFKQSSRK